MNPSYYPGYRNGCSANEDFISKSQSRTLLKMFLRQKEPAITSGLMNARSKDVGTHIKVTGLQVVSEKYHLFGICDSVEFEVISDGCYIPFLEETCRIYPVEYKHGKKRDEEEYNLQMAAQTLCLEEMFHTTITTGYIYYTGSKERFEVNISDKVRADAVKFIREISSYLENLHPIKPELRKRCNGCSLNDLCNPRKILVQDYMECIRKKYIV